MILKLYGNLGQMSVTFSLDTQAYRLSLILGLRKMRQGIQAAVAELFSGVGIR
jgi:hypothetical protein